MNIHLYPSDFSNESRVERQATFLLDEYKFDRVVLLGVGKDNFFLDKLEVVLLGGVSKFSITSRLTSLLLYYVGVIKFSWNKKIELINAHSLAVLPLGYIIKIISGAALVYDAHELETETNGRRGLSKLVSKWVEKLLIHRVDLVIVVGNNIADWYQDAYGIERPAVVYNAPVSRRINNNNFFRNQFGISKTALIFLYQGKLCAGRGIEALLEVFKQRTDGSVVVFMGFGPLENLITDAAEISDNIFYQKAVPPAEVLDYTASADVGLSLIEPVCLSYYYCMPNKLFEFSMAGLPVLVSNMKEMEAFVKKYEIGVVVQEISATSINAAINTLTQLDLRAIKSKSRVAADENSWERQLVTMRDRYSKLLNHR